MKSRKIYGIVGLLEWHGIVNSNGVNMKVEFTNGSVTAYGVAPATFTTENALTQHILENSDQFKSGRIRLLKVVELPEEKSAAPEPSTEEKAENPAAEATPEEKGEEDGTGEVQVIEVADKSEAVEYLKEHYEDKEYTSFKLRSKDAFDAACKECGVEFVFTA